MQEERNMAATIARDVLFFAASSWTMARSLATYGRYSQRVQARRLSNSVKDTKGSSPNATWSVGEHQPTPYANKSFKSYLSSDLRKAGGLYSLAISAVIPRPIALVTSQDKDENINCAPYSYFNLVSHDPPLIIVGNSLNVRAATKKKDTLRNIEETGMFLYRLTHSFLVNPVGEWFDSGQFVVSIMSDWYVESANHCSGAFPHEINEMEKAGLSSLPSDIVKPPRVGNAAIQLECEVRICVLSVVRGRAHPASSLLRLDISIDSREQRRQCPLIYLGLGQDSKIPRPRRSSDARVDWLTETHRRLA